MIIWISMIKNLKLEKLNYKNKKTIKVILCKFRMNLQMWFYIIKIIKKGQKNNSRKVDVMNSYLIVV